MRTLKLKLSVIGENRAEDYKRLNQISNDVWRMCNHISSGQYMNMKLMNSLYSRRKKDIESGVVTLEEIEEKFKEVFGVKRQATTERDIKELFPDIPSCVTNTMNQIVCASFNKDKKDVSMGNRSVRSYKKGTPISTSKASIDFEKVGDNHIVKWKLSRKESISFYIYYGRDGGNFKHTMEKVISGEIDHSASSIQRKDGNTYLFLPINDDVRKCELDENKSVGVDLGLAVPACIATQAGLNKEFIGNVDDFLKTRTQMQKRRKILQKNLGSARGGSGRQKKLKAQNRFSKKERNFVQQYNHFISKKIIDFALKNDCGTINLEYLKGFSKKEPDSFVLRNWSYFELQEMIKYKGLRYGIKTKYVDPYHTSQTCSVCGHYEKGQRTSQSEFKCASCGTKLNADYNAAKNIANSTKFVSKPEQCEYHKLKHKSED